MADGRFCFFTFLAKVGHVESKHPSLSWIPSKVRYSSYPSYYTVTFFTFWSFPQADKKDQGFALDWFQHIAFSHEKTFGSFAWKGRYTHVWTATDPGGRNNNVINTLRYSSSLLYIFRQRNRKLEYEGSPAGIYIYTGGRRLESGK